MKVAQYWLPSIIWAGFIFYLSSRQIGGISLFPWADKVAHIGIYIVLGFFVCNAFKKTSNMQKGKVVILSFLVVVLYGLSDEFHQMFVPTRSAEVADLLADAVGGLIGAWIQTLRY